MSTVSAAKVSVPEPLLRWTPLAAGSAILFVICYGIFTLVRQYFLDNGQPLDISRAQAVTFPLFGILVYLISRAFAPLRVLLILGCVSAGLLGVFYAYNYQLFANSSFVIATLNDDPFSSETRIFRKVIERESGQSGGVDVLSYYTSIADASGAKSLLAEDARTQGVVWGSRRWLNVTLGESGESSSISRFGANWMNEDLGGLKIIERVPWIGLSFKPVRQTASFLSAFFHGSPEMLKYAAQMKAPWTSYAHRGAAYLALGNHNLRQALQRDRYNPIELECAAENYRLGLSLVRSQDNHELNSALRNNLGVAWYLQGVLEGVKTLRSEGRAQITAAVKIPQRFKRRAPTFSSPKTAWENFQTIRIIQRKKSATRVTSELTNNAGLK